MSTNDTLRGRFLAWLPKYWNRETFIDDEGDELFIEDWVQGAWVGYSAALAEPVSGGVVLPDLTAAAKALCKHHSDVCGVNNDDQWAVYSEDFITDAKIVLGAALNGGAVAGRVSADRVSLLESAVREFAGFFSSDDARHWELHNLANDDAPISDCRQCRDACTCKGGE